MDVGLWLSPPGASKVLIAEPHHLWLACAVQLNPANPWSGACGDRLCVVFMSIQPNSGCGDVGGIRAATPRPTHSLLDGSACVTMNSTEKQSKHKLTSARRVAQIFYGQLNLTW